MVVSNTDPLKCKFFLSCKLTHKISNAYFLNRISSEKNSTHFTQPENLLTYFLENIPEMNNGFFFSFFFFKIIAEKIYSCIIKASYKLFTLKSSRTAHKLIFFFRLWWVEGKSLIWKTLRKITRKRFTTIFMLLQNRTPSS